MIENSKICPNCSKTFTYEDYYNEHKNWANEKQIQGWWKRRKYCCWDCNTAFHSKKQAEKRITNVKQSKLEFVAPVKIFDIENGKPTRIKILFHGKWKICKIEGEEK